jgi:fatty-acid desaturase
MDKVFFYHFSLGTLVSSTDKTDRHDITDILGKHSYILVTLYNILCMALYSMVVMCSNPVGGTSQYLYGFFLRVFLTTGERLK